MCGGGRGGGGGGVGLDSLTIKFPRRNVDSEPAPEPKAENKIRKLFSQLTGTAAIESEAEPAPRNKVFEAFSGATSPATALTAPAGEQAAVAPAASATGSRAPVAITELTGAGGVPRNKHTLGKATVLGS